MSVAPERAGCPAHRHGTAAAYERHGCRCADARAATRTNRKRRAAGVQPPGLVDATGTRRRIQALQRLGWSAGELAVRLGYKPHGAALSSVLGRARCQRVVAEHIAALYEQLCMLPGPSVVTRRRAAAKGWAPPLAWEDIDHDAAPVEAGSFSPDVINEQTIAKAMRGHLGAEGITRAERRSVVHRLSRRGVSVREIARRLGVQPRMVAADRAALGLVRPADQ